MTRKKIVVVLGMHRSGTSAITRSLQVLGVSLGENLHPAGFDNPKGFWEDSDVVRLNEQLLGSLGSAYDRVGLVTPPLRLEEFSQGLIDAAVNLIKSKAAGALVWGIKDPRISRLLVFWQHVLEAAGMDAVYVIAFRSPLSVADSLAKRNGFRRSKSFYLWLEHVLPALMLTEGKPRVVINYDKLMDDPRHEIDRMKSALGLEITSAQALQEYEQEFLDDSLRHTSYSSADLDSCPDAPGSLKRLFSLLCDVASEKVSLSTPEVSAEVHGLYADLHANASLLRLVADLEGDLQLAREELHRRESEQAAIASQRYHDVAGISDEQRKTIADLSTRLLRFEKFSRFAANAFSILFASAKWQEWAGNASQQPGPESLAPVFLELLRKTYNFDSSDYLSENPDVARSGMNAAEHFIAFGAMEERNPFAVDDVPAKDSGARRHS